MFRLSCVAWYCAALLLGGVDSAAFAGVLLAGVGTGSSVDAARIEARAELALRLQRYAALRLERLSGKEADRLRRAIAGGRELPLLGVELVAVGGVRVEARLTDASLAAYQREAARLNESLRSAGRGEPAPGVPAGEMTDALARIDQLQRIKVVLEAFRRPVAPYAGPDEATLSRRAVRQLPLTGSAGEIARSIKAELARNRIPGVRVVAPVRADVSEVTRLSGSIADALRAELGVPGVDMTAGYTLDGRYVPVENRLLVVLYLMDASFNTERAFAYVLPGDAERAFAPSQSAARLSSVLSRGLVRIDSLEGGDAPAAQPAAAPGGISVDVQTGRGKRALYYRPGDRDQLFVKLDRPGYYYIVGHVEKENFRLSYLMEIGSGGSGSRFVRTVRAADANRWQTVGEFSVELPLGAEALQVFASSQPPDRVLPATRYDSERRLHLISNDPVDAITRTRGLVRIEMAETKAAPGSQAAGQPPPAFGEAVLQFATLP